MTSRVGKEQAEIPLEGAVLCCTSISPEDRAQLAEYAQELGAKHTLDLTSDVTHLIVGSSNSEKYQYVAKHREDVKVLLPEWVHAIRTTWMADEVIDLNAIDAQYRCPTLYGLKICITGFADLDFRDELARNIAKHGGQYTGDLTKDVTHLIAFTPQGKKFEYAGAWGIKIVSLKWYKDTLDRGMQLDESLYHPAMSPEDQGNGAWNRQPSGTPRLGKRQRPDSMAQEPQRKLRRAASAKFSSQNHDMWNDIVGHGSATRSNDRGAKLQSANSVPDLREISNIPPNPELSGAETARRANSVPDKEDTLKTVSSGFLTNKHFAQKGFDEPRKALLFAALAGHGAVLHQSISDLLEGVDDDNDSHYLIVPHDIPSKNYLKIQKSLRKGAIVTELWLEYCMTVKAFVAPESYALAAPICPFEIAGISKLSVNASGFHQVQTMHMAKIVKKLGAAYQENFTPQTSVLIVNSNNPNQQKIIHATAWKVPVVTEKWLWKLIGSNRIPSFDHFAIPPPDLRAEPPRTTSQQSDRHRKIDADNKDTFVEAAKVIEARERQERTESRETRVRESEHPIEADWKPTRAAPLPLQEMSANIVSKVPRSGKRKLFRQFDGAHSDQIEGQNAVSRAHDVQQAVDDGMPPIIVDEQDDRRLSLDENGSECALAAPTSNPQRQQTSGDLLKDFFEVKAAAEAKKNAMSSNDSRSRRKKNFLGRAISNLSNSSRKSTEENIEPSRTKQPLSRASSINSVNTDGLGVPLSALSRIPSELIAKSTTYTQPGAAQKLSLAGNANKHSTHSTITIDPNHNADTSTNPTTSFHAALATLSTSQLPRPPSPTQVPQLTYAATDEAAKLRATLAEKRRTRARLGQNEGDPPPELDQDGKQTEKRMNELAREESEEKRQARWREERGLDKERGELIRDDERVVGAGRRTRGREKRLSALGGDGVVEFGEGNGVFEGM